MLLQRLKLWLLTLAGLLVCPLLQAQQVSLSESREIAAALQKAQSAAQKLNYSGTFIYQQANQIRTSRVSHAHDASGEIEKLEILDDKPREYLRRNDEVTCYLADSKTIQVEKNVTQEVFPALITAHPDALFEIYKIKKSETARVAGSNCQIFNFVPKDSLRFAYRLCLEKTSGLLLRAQTLNVKNEVIEQISFTQLDIGEVDKNKLKPSVQNTSQWKVEKLAVQSNISSGWSVNALPKGFKKIRELRRLIPVIQTGQNKADSAHTTDHSVIQMVYSDGLSTFSVFIETDTANRNPGSLQQGAMTIMSKRQGEHWLTVVGEVPFAAIKQVMNSIEFKTSK